MAKNKQKEPAAKALSVKKAKEKTEKTSVVTAKAAPSKKEVRAQISSGLEAAMLPFQSYYKTAAYKQLVKKAVRLFAEELQLPAKEQKKADSKLTASTDKAKTGKKK